MQAGVQQLTGASISIINELINGFEAGFVDEK